MEIPRLAKKDRREAGYLLFPQVFETNVCGHQYSLQIQCHVSNDGKRVPSSSSR